MNHIIYGLASARIVLMKGILDICI